MTRIPYKAKDLTPGLQIKLAIEGEKIQMVTIAGIKEMENRIFIATDAGTICRHPDHLVLTYLL